MEHAIVSREEWLEARKELLVKEKEYTRLHDEIAAHRRELPWVKVEKDYVFEGPDGEETLADLFGDRSQLFIYHFMYGPDWKEGCPSCSFWADNYNGTQVHLAHRDIAFAVISRAPLDHIEDYKRRMGWTFKWVSSIESDFNYDFQVSFTPEQCESGCIVYNYAPSNFSGEELPGASVFYKNDRGEVFHTYSCYARGLDMLNGAYQHMDLTPKGRDEQGLPYTMAWLRRHDQYED